MPVEGLMPGRGTSLSRRLRTLPCRRSGGRRLPPRVRLASSRVVSPGSELLNMLLTSWMTTADRTARCMRLIVIAATGWLVRQPPMRAVCLSSVALTDGLRTDGRTRLSRVYARVITARLQLQLPNWIQASFNVDRRRLLVVSVLTTVLLQFKQ